MSELIRDIDNALSAGDLNFAGALLEDLLHNDPDNVEGWAALARFCIETEKGAWAYPIMQMVVRKSPTWNNTMLLGAIESVLQLPDRAIKHLKRALNQLPESSPKQNLALIYRLIASTQVQAYNFDSAEHYAKLALEIEEHHQARTANAFAQLHKRNWEEGWRDYKHQLGHNKRRSKHDYGIPEWNGEPGKLLLYGDQGIGDQLAFMSACPPAHQINCERKLDKLFARTFPDAEVHGDQLKTGFDWELKSNYQCSMATAMQWSTVKRRGRYLKPHHDKSVQWRALLGSYSLKPKVGIAWTGGATGSDGWRTRNLTLEQLMPILNLPYTFVSLEYRECTDDVAAFKDSYGIEVLDFPWGTQTDDYDDTAALVDQLDAVICVPTSIYHLAGGLGVPACVLVHDQPHFHEGVEGDCPWWQSVDFIRRPDYKSDDKAILAAAEWLTNIIDDKQLQATG